MPRPATCVSAGDRLPVVTESGSAQWYGYGAQASRQRRHNAFGSRRCRERFRRLGPGNNARRPRCRHPPHPGYARRHRSRRHRPNGARMRRAPDRPRRWSPRTGETTRFPPADKRIRKTRRSARAPPRCRPPRESSRPTPTSTPLTHAIRCPSLRSTMPSTVTGNAGNLRSSSGDDSGMVRTATGIASSPISASLRIRSSSNRCSGVENSRPIRCRAHVSVMGTSARRTIPNAPATAHERHRPHAETAAGPSHVRPSDP